MTTFEDALAAAEQAFQAGDIQTALQSVQSVLDFPQGVELTREQFVEAVQEFAAIAKGNLSEAAERAAILVGYMPVHMDALYGFGYQMVEVGLFRLGATALARANVLAPQTPTILNELSSALESAGFNQHAFEALHAAPQARAQDWFTRYLYVFNAVMSGEMDAARAGFAELGPGTDTNTEFMRGKAAALIGRFDHLSGSSPLNETDLRGWHYVLTAGLLTHVSPHGFDEGMSGRYAMVQDRDELMHEGIMRAVAVLEAWDHMPTGVIHSPDRSSEVLAHAWHKRTGLPMKCFEPGDATSGGLFVAYDLLDADPHFLMALEERSPGQILVSHASCWTEEFPYTSDISTFLYQHNVVPWGEGRMRIDAASGQVEQLPVDTTTPAETLADAIVDSTLEAQALHDVDALVSLATAVGPPPQTGRRDRFYIGGPVTSSRFL